jgi:hypothetical protein
MGGNGFLKNIIFRGCTARPHGAMAVQWRRRLSFRYDARHAGNDTNSRAWRGAWPLRPRPIPESLEIGHLKKMKKNEKKKIQNRKRKTAFTQ